MVTARFVAVRFVITPTEVSDELTTLPASVVPVKVPASITEAKLIFVVPSKATPLMVLALANLVALPALPVIVPLIALVTARFVAVKLLIIPTEVSDELTTLPASVVPVNVPASITEAKLIFVVPSKATPLIVLALASLVALVIVPLI